MNGNQKMKKSEMIELLRQFLSYEQGYKEDWSYAEDIVDFLISQGMRPPSYAVKVELPSPVIEDGNGSKMLLPVYRYETVIKEGWDPEK